MIVYRVEITDTDYSGYKVNSNIGVGPYTGVSGFAEIICSDSSSSSHPTPKNDSNLGKVFDSDHVCCFKSLEQLHTWFDLIPDLSDHDKKLFKISTYQIKDEYYHQGKFQSIAHSEHMVLLEEHPINFGLRGY